MVLRWARLALQAAHVWRLGPWPQRVAERSSVQRGPVKGLWVEPHAVSCLAVWPLPVPRRELVDDALVGVADCLRRFRAEEGLALIAELGNIRNNRHGAQ